MMSLYLCSNQIELENKSHFQNATLSAHTYYEPDIMLIKSDVWRRGGNTMEPQPGFGDISKKLPLLQKSDKKLLRLPCLPRFSQSRHSYCLKVSGQETISPQQQR